MKIVLEDERPISWNKFYAGMHWAVRSDEKDRVQKLIGAWTRNWLTMLDASFMNPYQCRVDIHITAYFAHHPQDPDNICSKVYIDGLKGTHIENDTRQYVRKVTVQSEIDRENPRVEIEIREVEE